MKTKRLVKSGLLSLAVCLVAAPAWATTYNTTFSFDAPVTVDTAQAPGVWYPDRYRPAAFESYSFSGENVLKVGIAGIDDGSAARAVTGQAGTFYNTHGRKLDLPPGTTALTAKLYVPADWLAPTARRRSDVWATGVDESNTISSYPIIGFANVDGTSVIRYYDFNGSGGWVTTAITPEADTWYTFEMEISGENLIYKVNGAVVGSLPANGTKALSNTIVQAYNFNDPALPVDQQSTDSYDAYWDNLGFAYPEIKNITQNSVHATLAAAVAAANPGDVIALAPGTYTEAPVDINKAVTIRGANHGLAGTATRADESKIANTRLFVNAAGVIIDGVEIDQTDNTQDAILMQAPATVSNSVIKRMGVTTGQPVRGITTSVGLSGFTISGNLFTGDGSGGFFSGHKTWNSGIYINGGSGAITGNTFENCRSANNLDDFNAGLTITGNTYRTCGTYVSFGGVSPTDGQYTISGNEFYLDFPNISTNWLPSTVFNNSNVAPSFRLDATGNTFGGLATTALTNSQKFALEARMYHRGRSGRNGVVDYVVGEQVVMPGTTIASAIAAAATGNTVLVGPGTYAEGTVTLNKALTLSGANVGVAGSASGRSAETILSSSRCLIAADNVVIDGFKFTGTPPGAVIDGINQNASHVGVRNNLFENIANTGIYLMGSGTREDWTIASNRFQGIGQVDGTLGTGTSSAMNLWSSNGMTVTDNVIDTVDYNGLNLDTVVGATVTGNTFNNIGKSGLQVANACAGPILIECNAFDGCNKRYALDQNYWYGAVKLYTSTMTGNITIRNNELRNSVVGFLMARILGPSTNLVFEDNIVTGNSLGGFLQYWGAGQPVGLTKNYWGSSTGPAIGTFNNVPATPIRQITGGGDGDAILTALDGGTIVAFSPWYADAGRTILRDGITSNTEVSGSQTFTNLYVAPGTTVTVTPEGSLAADKVELADGAEITVNGGELDLGQGSVISGTFTIFNSFGSWDINGDTTFNIGQSLALISDIHVAAGKTVNVRGGGELILDGCIIDSQTQGTPYNFTAETDGLLTLARCVVTDANIDINTTLAGNLRSRVYDSSFITSDIEAAPAAKVYHNLFDAATDIAKNTDATTAFDAIDGWANVTDAGDLRNKFTLDFEAPAAIGRTLDVDGNLFVQPADAVVVKMDVAALGTNTITAAEALLGYNSGMLSLAGSPTRVTPLGAWEVIAETAPAPSGLGIVDSALGLQLNAGEEGISADSQIAKVNFTAGSPGLTLGFFRVQTDGLFNPDGTLVKDTRLTKSTAGMPSLLEAFTTNTGELIIDNELPAIATTGQTGTQVQPTNGTVDVLNPANYVIRNGTPVMLSFTATDAGLAGLDAPDATADLVLTAYNGTTTLGTADYTVTAMEAAGVVTYTVTLNVPSTASTGTYAVTATVRDRSGNVSPLTTLGSFQIANEVLATIELEAYAGGNRDVVFTATDSSGTALTSWTKTVVFTGTTGTVPLEAVPAGTAAISAKTAWNLRSKLPAVFSPVGVSAVSLTGTDKLPGGDLTGDNVVNTLDYSALRYHWLTDHPVADINGDAVVNLADYGLLKGNFYTIGDPQ